MASSDKGGASAAVAGAPGHGAPEGGTRRDFLFLAAGAFGAIGSAAVAWPLIDSLNPAADTLAAAQPFNIDVSSVKEGQGITVKYLGEPIFIRRRTQKEIEEARKVPMAELIDPQTDQARVYKGKDQWLVVKGVCTHLGCVPLGQSPNDNRGAYGGYYCPCHGSAYDTSGRIRKGPAPENLWIPPYQFPSDTVIRVGAQPTDGGPKPTS
jgi:ubiquinol-cytochrome c reductase iron-sulfur subunit